ncbi:putative zinc-binding metallopeptidase [Paludibacteraceae bacterium OttesenSCG-928-F17]|nr:putative zinc-binding metallopeptidase [Paludibacteraceae bacterium OttesenSCG-928-F17]
MGDSIIVIPEVSNDPLDMWIQKTYTEPYNISVQYKWNSADSDLAKDLVPPRKELVQDFLKAVYKIWLNPYLSVTEQKEGFMKEYVNRELKLIGSGSWNSGSVTLGLAENGYKITLYTVNDFKLNGGMERETLERFFRTFHHEFGHILNQRKPFSETFQYITPDYQADWTSIKDDEAQQRGFVSAYSRSGAGEDFVEIMSFYITKTPTQWSDFMTEINNDSSVNLIETKVREVASYLRESYSVDMDLLRDYITTAISEVSDGNLEMNEN